MLPASRLRLVRGLSSKIPATSRRPFARADSERLRHTVNGAFVLPQRNPGIRVHPDFVTEEEAGYMLTVCEDSAELYGYPYDGETRTHTISVDGNIESSSDLINNVRVTGRLERPDLPQRLPPWGYGDEFDEAALPSTLASLAARIRWFNPYLGPLRDVTMNGALIRAKLCSLYHAPRTQPRIAAAERRPRQRLLSARPTPRSGVGRARRLHPLSPLHGRAHVHADG